MQQLSPSPVATSAALSPAQLNSRQRRRAARQWRRLGWLGAAAVISPVLAATAHAADAAPVGTNTQAKATALPKKPAWLTDLSLSLKAGYDNNVFAAGADPQYYPATYVVPAGSVAATRNQGSFVTTVSPKVGINFAPLLGDQKVLQSLSLGYVPDFVTYHDESSESYNLHRVTAGIKGKADAFSFNLDNAFHYIDGNKYGVTFPGAFNSAYATAATRERREQIQDRSKAVLQYDFEKWFVRPTASLLYYDLKTEQINTPGYQNYADRYDVNGGTDVGYRVTPDIAATLGYRYGHQGQQQYSWDTSLLSSPSDYHRVLAGIEGKPFKWLKVELQAGPDFRSYEENTATHITPVTDKDPIKYYGEASLTAEIDPKDTVAFKYKQFQWVSSTGRVPYFDSQYDLSYKRKLTDQLGLDLGAKLSTSDYTSGNVASSLRDDWQYTLTAALRYAANPHLSFDLAYAVDLGRNAQDELPAAQQPDDKREFTRHVVSLGANFKF